MAFSFSRNRDDIMGDLERQIASLSREVKSLRRGASRRGGDLYEDATDMVSDLVERLFSRSEGRNSVMRQAQWVDRAVRRHPGSSALIGLAVVGIAAAVLLRR